MIIESKMEGMRGAEAETIRGDPKQKMKNGMRLLGRVDEQRKEGGQIMDLYCSYFTKK